MSGRPSSKIQSTGKGSKASTKPDISASKASIYGPAANDPTRNKPSGQDVSQAIHSILYFLSMTATRPIIVGIPRGAWTSILSGSIIHLAKPFRTVLVCPN